MSVYGQELSAVQRQSDAAYEAMEAWVSRPIGAPEVPGAALESHAKALRESRERMRALLAEHGTRDDIEAALIKNQEQHRRLGLTIRDQPEPPDQEHP